MQVSLPNDEAMLEVDASAKAARIPVKVDHAILEVARACDAALYYL